MTKRYKMFLIIQGKKSVVQTAYAFFLGLQKTPSETGSDHESYSCFLPYLQCLLPTILMRNVSYETRYLLWQMYRDPSLTSCDVNSRSTWNTFNVISNRHYTSSTVQKCLQKYNTWFLSTLTGTEWDVLIACWYARLTDIFQSHGSWDPIWHRLC